MSEIGPGAEMAMANEGRIFRDVVPARRGRAYRASKGNLVRIVNTHGAQVVDFWALDASATLEHLSMEHSVVEMQRVQPRPGDLLYSNLRKPMLRLEKDTSPGVHCMLFAACDAQRYRHLGYDGIHDNCSDNFHVALAEAGKTDYFYTPAPLNLFMNVVVDRSGSMQVQAPVSRPGDWIEFRSLRDLMIVVSSCPQDMVPVNGAGCTPTDFSVEIRG